MMVSLRAATNSDARLVFGWRNDPFIVERGSSQKTVTWEEHEKWFQATVNGPERKMFIAEVDGKPAGQVRFDRMGSGSDRCVVSAYLLERFTGRGLGVEAIRQGCERIFRQWPVMQVIACVRRDNAAGLAGFQKAGFKEQTGDCGCPADHFSLVLRRPTGAARS